jgi:glyoxylate reductase
VPGQSVYVTRTIAPSALEILSASGFAVDVWPEDRAVPRDVLLREVAARDGLLCQLTDRVDAGLLASAPRLRAVATASVGFEHLDLAALAARGIRPSNTPGVLTEATAELAMALLLAAARHVVAADRFVREGRFRGFSPSLFLGLELAGATLGVVGAGRIGREVARRAAAFGMRLVYAALRPCPEIEALGASRRTLDELLRESDAVSLHVRLTEATRHLVGARELALMKPTAILVNTSRGPVVDEAALVEALRARRIAGAGLDVYEREPELAAGLAALESAVLLPHLGSATAATRRRMAETAAKDLARALRGEPLENPIEENAHG